MKTQHFLLSGILGIALAGVVLTGCHKNSTTPDTDYTAAEDEANASMAMNDSKNVSDAAMQGSSGTYSPVHSIRSIYSSHCMVWWASNADTVTYAADTVYISFGSTPTLCNDGRYRQGEIIVYWSKGNAPYVWSAYWTTGDTITMTFKNYYIGSSSGNMIGVTGTRQLINKGTNSLNQVNWNFTANLTLTYNTGQTATWNSIRTNTLVQPGGTGTTYYYEITGSAYGVSRKGVSYTISIVNPLYVTAYPWWWPGENGCKWIESGTVNINRTTSTNTLTIDFGTLGSCDANAVATLNGVSYPFTMW